MAQKPTEMPWKEKEPARKFVKKYKLGEHSAAHLELIELLERVYSSALKASDQYYDGILRNVQHLPKE